MASSPCQQVVVINVNGLVGVLAGFPNQYIGKFFPVQVFNYGIILAGIEQIKPSVCPDAGHGADGFQHFVLILAGHDGAGCNAVLVADLADAADCLQIKGVFVDLTGGYRQDNADGARVSGMPGCWPGNWVHSPVLSWHFTLRFVSSLMEGLSLQVRETVEADTPASAATSLMVTDMIPASFLC